ncbi:MAG TPA: Ger(x)C family spore germination C-terminal domain-containing protein, partial [Symbiobacteriaceae bacterium]|nr:Ger(x)C family spore germination C-terminal domain-containing protein [Symbiobacteriaceae bacterium]
SAKPESQRRLVPGISRRKGGPAVDFFGAAAFRQTKMVGALDAQDTRAMLLVQNTFAQSTLDVVDPHAPDRTGAVRISTGRPTKVKVKLNNGRPQFEILITLEGEVIGMPALVDYTKSDMRDQLESHVAEEVKEQVETFFKKTQEWQSDVGGLGRYIVRKFPTVDAWHHFNWPNQYKDAQITVSVRMQLRRFGVQLSPQPSGSREKME